MITVQRDTDGDGEPDITDTDDDGDGFTDIEEAVSYTHLDVYKRQAGQFPACRRRKYP